MRLFHTHAQSVVLTALAVCLLSGCSHGDDCRVPEFRCDGDVALNCIFAEDGYGSYQTFQEIDCGATKCQVDDQGAFCPLAPTPTPACNAASDPVCDGSTVLECRAGYAVSSYDCAAQTNSGGVYSPPWHGSEGSFCKAVSAPNFVTQVMTPHAFCAVESAPVDACKGVPYVSFDPMWRCDADDRVECFYGYVLDRVSCDKECRGSATECM